MCDVRVVLLSHHAVGHKKKPRLLVCVCVCVACRCAHYSYVKCLWPSNSRAQLPPGALLEYSRNKTIGTFYQHSTLLIQAFLLMHVEQYGSIFLGLISTR